MSRARVDGARPCFARRPHPTCQPAQLALRGERAQASTGDARLEIVADLDKFAAGTGPTGLDLANGRLVTNPLVSSDTCRATKPEQVVANAAAPWHLNDAELAPLDAIVA